MRKRRKSACLIVESYKGEKVFVLGKLRFDRLGPYEGMAQHRHFTNVRVFRENKLFDKGAIAEYGTHAASLRFLGFEKVKTSWLNREPLIFDDMLAKWFNVGDKIRIGILAATLRRNILVNWRSQVHQWSRFVKRFKKARENADKLILKISVRKNLSFVQKTDLTLKLHRKAFLSVEKLVRKVPIPEVIHF